MRGSCYFVQGTIAEVPGGLSNFAVLTAENSAPVANADKYTTGFNVPVAGNVLTNDTDVDSAPPRCAPRW